MKKLNIWGKFCLAFIATMTLMAVLTSFSPTTDGRAVIANEGKMPKGIFAKAAGYLPGDSVNVSNLAKQTNVSVLVIGTLDINEGVGILLSPEAASMLGLERGSNMTVKISKRSGQLDETVNGTAVVSIAPDEVEEETPTAPTIDTEIAKESEEPPAKEPEPEIAKVEEPAPTPEPEPEATKVDDSDVQFLGEASEIGSITDLKDKADETAKVEYEEKVEDELNGTPALEAIDDADLALKEEPLPPPEAVEEPKKEEEVVYEKVDETQPATKPDDKVYERIYADELNNIANADAQSEKVASDTLKNRTPAESQEVVIDMPPEENCPTCPQVAKDTDWGSEKVNSDDLAKLDDKAPEESYEAIALADPELEPLEEKISANVPPIEEPVKETLADKIDKIEIPEDTDDFAQYMVPSLSSLEPGKFYIQIAVFSDKNNLAKTMTKFQDNYPITLVPLKNNNKATQVMIGPLDQDEYGVILNRVKDKGYKDAFLRKVR